MSHAAPSRSSALRWLAALLPGSSATICAAICCSALGSLALAVDPLLFKNLIDYALPHQSLRRAAVLIVAIGLCIVVKSALYGCGSLLQMRLVNKLSTDIKQRVLSVWGESRGQREPANLGEALTVIDYDVTLVCTLLGDFVVVAMRVVAILLTSLYMMWRLNHLITAITCIGAPAYVIVQQIYRVRLMKSSREARDARGVFSAVSSDVITALPELRLLGAQTFYRHKAMKLWAKVCQTLLSQKLSEVSYGVVVSCVLACVGIAVLWLASQRVILSWMTVGTLVAFYTYALRLFEPLAWATDFFVRSQGAYPSVERLREATQSFEKAIDAPPAGFSLSTAWRLSLQDVKVSRQSSTILKCPDLSIEFGDRIGVVGPSGAGKTTMMRMIGGLEAPTEGRVLIDGLDIQEYPADLLRSFIGYVSSTSVLPDGTLREIITCGDSSIGDDRIEKILGVTQLLGRLKTLANGLETPIQVAAASLSSGERQRLAIARSLVRNPRLLLLDEATSGMDSVIEAAFYRDLFTLSPDLTVVSVSHRLRQLTWADKYYVLEGGEIVGAGHHDYLLADCAVYRNMYMGGAEEASLLGISNRSSVFQAASQ